MQKVSHRRLTSLLHYDPETGVFRWRVRRGHIRKGDVAGSIRTSGYRRIVIDRRWYLAARLAFFYMEKHWPPNVMDHINRIRDDDRWKNLRAATIAQNCANSGLRKNNTSGYRGVCFLKRENKFQARVGIRGGRVAKRFSTLAAAAKWAAETRRRLHGEFAGEG